MSKAAPPEPQIGPEHIEALAEAMRAILAKTSLAHTDNVPEPGYPFNRYARALLPIITAHTAAAVAAERERCAKLVEDYANSRHKP
jgi:hypothetical protein